MEAQNAKAYRGKVKAAQRGVISYTASTVAIPAVHVFPTAWGWMGISETTQGIDTIVMPNISRHAAQTEFRAGVIPQINTQSSLRLRVAQGQLTKYLSGQRILFCLLLDLSRGTSFQQKVWRILQRIPYGALRSYQWVAIRVGGRQYARAVGNAVGANPLPILIPCHRVVAHDGTLGGFTGGLTRKRKLLRLEGTLDKIRLG